jgi:hypothetical protein
MSFKNAVEATPTVKDAYRPGLQALRRTDRAHVECADPRRITGSIDLDEALKADRPDDHRWDYGIGLRDGQGKAQDRVFWLEIHPASASRHVDDVIDKATWLRAWLNSDAPSLAKLPRQYIWVATGKVAISPNSPKLRQLAKSGLQVRFEPRRLELL